MYEAILDQYDELFSKLDPASPEHEALHWEQTGFEIIFSLLTSLNIPVTFKPDDIRPIVRTLDGKAVEIDFRMEIENIPVYFGVTAFYNRAADLGKDVVHENTPVHGLKRQTFKDGKLIWTEDIGTWQIIGRRPQTQYLNRRMAVRIAREGRNQFGCDYIYIFLPQLNADIDGIPAGFTFESKYSFKKNAIKGVLLVGRAVDKKPDGSMSIEKYKWAIRAKPVGCSPAMERFLRRVDGIRLDLRDRLKAERTILEANQADPEFQRYLKVFLKKYGDLT